MSIEIITLVTFGALIICFMMGLPVAFTLGGVALMLALWLWGPESLFIISQAFRSSMFSFVLAAIPLFIFIGNILERSGIADNLYDVMHRWFGAIRGGLAAGTIVICTVIAAMVGLIGPGIVTMGIIALPAMLRRKYQPELGLGAIMAGGALGALIPPSVEMMIFSLIANVSVGHMFMGGIVPGLILSTLYITYILIRSHLQPQLAPAAMPEERGTWGDKFASLKGLILPIFIVLAMLVSIFLGIATPTEAASVGVVATILATAINRRLSWTVLKEAAYRTARLSAMVVWIVFGAMVFSRFYFAVGCADMVSGLLSGLELPPIAVIGVMMLTLLLLGMIMEDWAIVMVAGPIYTPIAVSLGFNPLWFGVLFIVNMQIAVLTPPYGFGLFYMRGVAPEGITMAHIYRAILPFTMLQLIGLGLVMAFPQLVLWLPSIILGR